ncbi:MAG TPA: gamma-glutamyl-gamma-aminobutyrate hydrolase family protein [Vicinamibacterales bacterium]|jgi:putative glutamine amidotransferase|nr:gamma-glutamyl-gamma-aminobutyrate hydrolase family protein [Vicinamibacterales bacterium]
MAVIGITTCRKLEDYRQAILHVGGESRILEPAMTPDQALEGIAGLLLTGGDDVAPARYGEPPHSTVVEADAPQEEFEIALVNQARAKQLPILAICRGIQVLNVACGGTLVQDIPSQLPGSLEHTLAVPPNQSYSLAHEVWLEKDSLLSRLMRERLSDADTCEVNSRHHQAVKQVATGFRVSATAPDGVIEAIEDPSAPFCLGVQWHPENFWRTGEFRALFEGFLEAAHTFGERP